MTLRMNEILRQLVYTTRTSDLMGKEALPTKVSGNGQVFIEILSKFVIQVRDLVISDQI